MRAVHLRETRPTNGWQNYGTHNGDGEMISNEGLGDVKQTACSRRFPRTFWIAFNPLCSRSDSSWDR